MAVPMYTKKTAENNQVQYRKDGNLVAKASIPDDVLQKLSIAPEGTPVPESADVVATPENTAVDPVGSADSGAVGSAPVPESADVSEKRVKIHLERNIMVNGKVYLGGYDTEVNEETGDVLSETPIEIEVTQEMAEELKRIDRDHTTYERNLIRGQNRAKTAPQVKEVRAS